MLKQDLIRIKQKMCDHSQVSRCCIFLCHLLHTKYDLLLKRRYNLGQIEFNGIHLVALVVKSFKFPVLIRIFGRNQTLNNFVYYAIVSAACSLSYSILFKVGDIRLVLIVGGKNANQTIKNTAQPIVKRNMASFWKFKTFDDNRHKVDTIELQLTQVVTPF